MTDLLARNFGALRQKIQLLRMQLMNSPQLINTISKSATSWTTSIQQRITLTKELQNEVTALRNQKATSPTLDLIANDIENMFLRTVQGLVSQTDVSTYTDITTSDLATTTVEIITTHITHITSRVVTTFKTAQTNELSLKKISATSITLTRTVKLNKIEEDHKHLLDKHDYLSQ